RTYRRCRARGRHRPGPAMHRRPACVIAPSPGAAAARTAVATPTTPARPTPATRPRATPSALRSARSRVDGPGLGPGRLPCPECAWHPATVACRRLSAASRGHVALAFGRVMPPRAWRRAFHEAHGTDEGVDHARVVAHAGRAAQAFVQDVGILAGELRGPFDADVAEVLDHRRADVGDVGELPGLAGAACLGHQP